MPNVIDGTDRLIREKSRLVFVKLTYFSNSTSTWGYEVYTKLSAADYRKIEIMRPPEAVREKLKYLLERIVVPPPKLGGLMETGDWDRCRCYRHCGAKSRSTGMEDFRRNG